MCTKKYPSYSIAIRTLGTAGEKYLETLNSCNRQTIKPERIYIYIPYGYALPKETIGREEYIRCSKGMVSQRSLSFDEITTDFILFLDDDLSFKENFVQLLFDGLLENKGDCISPDIYSIHKNNIWIKIRDVFGGTYPHFDRKWAFKIRHNAHYSYNNNPISNVLLTQSGAGACALCKKDVFRAIHFEDERWIENVSYSLGEDQLFFYKMYKYGYKVLISYNVQIKHLDAGAGHKKDKQRLAFAFGFCRYVIWYRTIYSERASVCHKLVCILSFICGFLRSLPLTFITILKYRSVAYFMNNLKGIYKGITYVKSCEYREIPLFYKYK